MKLYSLDILLIAIIVGVCIIGYAKIIIKLSECDFEPPYKAEVIHTAGIFPPVGVVTGWIDAGK